MRDLTSLAEQIRAVRQAQRRFIGRWRLEQVIIGPELLDHLADQMAAAHAELDAPDAEESVMATDVNPGNSTGGDWGYSRSRLWSM